MLDLLPPKVVSLFFLAVMVCLGCVRVEANKQPSRGTRMLVTRDINGVQLQWDSEKDRGYTIYWRNPRVPNDTWKELPGAVEIRGTGETIRIRDDVPNASQRNYRIETLEKASEARSSRSSRS